MSQGFIAQLPGRLMKVSSGALVPAVGWKISTFATNSTTPVDTWSDGQLSSLNTNPVITDADGGFRIFIAQGSTIKCVVTDEDDVSQFPFTFDYQQPMIPDPAAAASTSVQTGSILAWSTDTAPTGYLLCDGSAVSRATYSDLNTLLAAATPSYPFGNGNGTTTFNVPDLRGRFPLGTATAGTGSTLGGSGGLIDHVHTGPSHTHTVDVTRDGWGGTQAVGSSPQGRMQASDGVALNLTVADNDQTFTSAAGGTGNTGTANPPFLSLNWIIKT